MEHLNTDICITLTLHSCHLCLLIWWSARMLRVVSMVTKLIVCIWCGNQPFITKTCRNKSQIYLKCMIQHFPTKCNLPPGLHRNNFFRPGYLFVIFWISGYFTNVHYTPLKVHWKLTSKKVILIFYKVKSESSEGVPPW